MTIGMCHLGGILNIFIVNWNKYRNYWFATGRMIYSMTNSPSAAVSTSDSNTNVDIIFSVLFNMVWLYWYVISDWFFFYKINASHLFLLVFRKFSLFKFFLLSYIDSRDILFSLLQTQICDYHWIALQNHDVIVGINN